MTSLPSLVRLVTPAIAIGTSAASATTGAAVLVTDAPHYYVSGDTVTIAGHTGAAPALDGAHVVTVLTPTSFSVPIALTTGGTGGTATRTSQAEPLTVTEGKLRAGLTWPEGDPRDALMASFIAASRAKVEQDTGLALLYQTHDLVFVLGVIDPASLSPAQLPGQCAPVVAIEVIADASGTRVRIVSGWPSPAAVPPMLLQAVGLLTAHYATAGRDLVANASDNRSDEMPFGYEDLIAPHRIMVLA